MSFTINQPHYEGPLDALLSLVEERKLSISDISLAQVTDEYLAYVGSLDSAPVGQVTQFIWVAATLVLLKAKSLLPTIDFSSEEESDIATLELRLKQLAAVRAHSRTLERLWDATPLYRRASTLGRVSVFTPESVSVEVMHESIRTIIGMFRQYQNEIESEKLHEVVVAQTIRLEDVIAKIGDVIQHAKVGKFSSLTSGITEKRSLIVTFLALLEMARQARVSIIQHDSFDDIEFKSYESSEFVGESN